VNPVELERQVDTLELINTELAARLDRLSDGAAKVDNKAVVLVGYVGAAAAFLATRKPEFVLAALAYAAFAVAAGFGIWIFAATLYKDTPDPPFFASKFDESKANVLARLIITRVDVHEANHKKQTSKVWRWRACLVGWAVGMVLLTASLLV
jgi:hypothetical protein